MAEMMTAAEIMAADREIAEASWERGEEEEAWEAPSDRRMAEAWQRIAEAEEEAEISAAEEAAWDGGTDSDIGWA